MPRSWPRPPDRKDPEFRKVEDIMNFVVHVFVFTSSNSGLWFFKILWQADWNWAMNFTLGWLGILLLHALYIFVIADYSVKSNG
jgi:2TM domain